MNAEMKKDALIGCGSYVTAGEAPMGITIRCSRRAGHLFEHTAADKGWWLSWQDEFSYRSLPDSAAVS